MIQPEPEMMDTQGLNRLIGADGQARNAISSQVWYLSNLRSEQHLIYEGPGDWRGRQGARAGVEAAPVAPGVANILLAGEWRHLRGSRMPARRPQKPL